MGLNVLGGVPDLMAVPGDLPEPSRKMGGSVSVCAGSVLVTGAVRVDSAPVLRHTYFPTALPPLSLQPGGLRIWPILVG